MTVDIFDRGNYTSAEITVGRFSLKLVVVGGNNVVILANVWYDWRNGLRNVVFNKSRKGVIFLRDKMWMDDLDERFDEARARKAVKKTVELESDDAVEAVEATVPRALVKSAASLSCHDARDLVFDYWRVQEDRIRKQHRIRERSKLGLEPHGITLYFLEQDMIREKNQRKMIAKYVPTQNIGQWMLSINGIGPVFAAGLMALIDISKVEYVGQIWRYAGLDPTQEWAEGQLRPWNARLKTICYLIGESFVKSRNGKKDIYGQIYYKRKQEEQAKNLAGDYAEYAAKMLRKKKFKEDKIAYQYYSIGQLPPGHIENRAMRYAVKMFLSHLFMVWYEMDRGRKPAKPFVISRTLLGNDEYGFHSHLLNPPNWENGRIVQNHQLTVTDVGTGVTVPYVS